MEKENTMNKNSRKGFTLIEMLVVVAIIGILSAAVLVALGPSREKARDARIISGVQQARAIAETIYNPGSQIPYEGLSAIAPASMGTINTEITGQQTAVGTPGLQVTLSNGGKGFVMYAELNTKTPAGLPQYQCADNTGASRIVNSVPSGTTCPN